MGKVYNNPSNGHIFVEDTNGRLVWSTQIRPVNLLPESNWIQQNVSIEFPDFTKFVNYGYMRYWSVPPGGWTPSGTGDTCTSVTMIQPENRTLPSINLGTVPSGVNYIDVRVRVQRTKNPYIYLEQTPPQLIPNQWIHLPGGSCIVEATNIWRRSFEVVLSGNNVNLIRRQSVCGIGDAAYPIENIYRNLGGKGGGAGENPWGQSTISYWANVNSSGSDYTGVQRDGHPAALIEAKDYSPNLGMGGDTPAYGGKHLRRFNACSINNSSHDYSSTFTGEIVIRPGYIPT